MKEIKIEKLAKKIGLPDDIKVYDSLYQALKEVSNTFKYYQNPIKK